MILSVKKIGFAALVGALGLLAAATLAWACSPQATLFGIAPLAGSPGTEVKMQGAGVAPGSVVEIHWNSPSGEKLGEAIAGPDGNFAVSVKVSEQDPGVYYLLAVSAGNGMSIARNAFEVTDSKPEMGRSGSVSVNAVTSVSSDLWTGLEASNSSSHVADPIDSIKDITARPGMSVGLGMLALGSVALIAIPLARRRAQAAR